MYMFLWILYLAFSILIIYFKFKDLYYKTNTFPKLIIIWLVFTFIMWCTWYLYYLH